MKLIRTVLISLLLIAMLAVAGCTTTPGGQVATTTTQSAGPGTTTTQSAGPGQTTAQPGQTSFGEACSRDSVPGATLVNYVPSAQSGWTMDGSPEWFTMATGEGCDYTMAFASYEKGSMDFAFTIYDTNYWGGFAWSALWGFSYQTSDGYAKSVTVNGYPGFEMGDYDTNDITVMVDCGNGIMVFGMLSESTDTGTIYAYMNSVNYAGLAGLT